MVYRSFRRKTRKQTRSEAMLAAVQRWGSDAEARPASQPRAEEDADRGPRERQASGRDEES